MVQISANYVRNMDQALLYTLLDVASMLGRVHVSECLLNGFYLGI